MSTKLSSLRFTLRSAIIAIGFLVGLIFSVDRSLVTSPDSLILRFPTFLSLAKAQAQTTDDIGTFLDDEAGISAYVQTNEPITLSNIRKIFRTIELDEPSYIIGSIPVPGYDEQHDVHALVHTDGWIIAYYLNSDPAGKIIDWTNYRIEVGSSIPTKLEKILGIIVTEASVPLREIRYYDFRYPNATNLILIAKYGNGESFEITLPEDYVYYHRSWSLYSSSGYAAQTHLDGTRINIATGHTYGVLSADQLSTNVKHTMSVNGSGISSATGYVGLVIIYRGPQ